MTAPNLGAVFNTATGLYHARRPHYPAELFEELIVETKLTRNAELLEIGPGTGQATQPLAARGYGITAIELGEELAAKARKELDGYPNVKVITGAFEDVELPDDHYDLIYSATAFHWIQPELKFTKPYRLLRLGGYLAIIHTEHVSDEAGDAFFFASEPIHAKYRGKGKPINKQGDSRPPRLADLKPPEQIDTSLFVLQSFSIFPLTISYTSQEYVELLGTYSPQLVMPKAKREAFLQELKALIDKDFGGRMSKHYGMTLTIARKLHQ